MINLLKWLLFPTLYISGGGGGDGGASAREQQEEQRKRELRARIDRLYGIGEPAKAGSGGYKIEWIQQPDKTWRGVRNDTNDVIETLQPGESPQSAAFREGGTRTVPGEKPQDARTAMDQENTKLADATRGYYTDQLGKNYATAERNTRFKLARQGLLGSSEDVNQQGEVKSDRDLGATRVDEAVARSVAGLKTQREQERLQSIQLVNSGAGESAVSAAQSGLRNSFDNAATAQKADLFGDLFTHSADAVATSNVADQQAALLGRYRDRLSSFFPTKSTSGGRVTPSA